MSPEDALLPPGFRDRLPPAAEAALDLRRRTGDIFRAHGYQAVEPPLVEHEGSLANWLDRPPASALFRTSDPATGEALALRPDITRQVARIAATGLSSAPRPLRLSYAGQVLRGRAGQLSPERQRIQAGAELIGNDGEAALAELVSMAVDALKAAGVPTLSIDLTTPELVQDLAAGKWPVADLPGLLQALDRKDRGALAGERAPYRALLDLAGPAADALPALSAVAPEAAARLAALVSALPALRITIDPTERHGFEYQSWIGFSLFSGDAAAYPAELGRGGAYRIRHLDGRREPAAGLSLYLDALVEAGYGSDTARRLFLPLGTPAAEARHLREQGWVTVQALSDSDRATGCTHIWNGTAAVATG